MAPGYGVHENVGVIDTPVDAFMGDSISKGPPTKLYVNAALALAEKFDVHGIAHITGGGFIENIPRILPDGLCAEVDLDSFPRLPIFDLLAKKSGLGDDKLYNTFNMGIGMVFAVGAEEAEEVKEYAIKSGESAYIIGRVAEGSGVKLARGGISR